MQPDRVLDFEPEEARKLRWLPLAVRFKLDKCGLKLGLQQWQALDLCQREALVRRPPGDLFEQRVLELVPAARRFAAAGLQAPLAFDEYVIAKRTSAATSCKRPAG
ncbi:nitrate reductase associated protein [Ramlibacter sp. AN1133]|uniref:nitrate reductase associated protein n=1 Tax=Ramlibacter sp. AN1133 TaxID=3133429 RepID=UPI0030BA5501